MALSKVALQCLKSSSYFVQDILNMRDGVHELNRERYQSICLIGTDALARGIDIPECDYVISYDPPRNIKTYIHRVGRTGRAGRSGCAVTILLQNQVNMFKETLQMESQSNLPQIEIPEDIFERLSESYENAINATKNLIHEEITSKVKKSVALKRGLKKRPKKRKPEQQADEASEHKLLKQ